MEPTRIRQWTKRTIGLAAAAAMLATINPAPVHAANGTKDLHLTVAVPSLQLLELAPLSVAKDKGYFAKQHLVVTFQEYPKGGNAAAQALLSGQADVSVQGILQGVRARAKNQPIVILGAVTDTLGYALVARNQSGVESVADLAGKTVGVSTPGSGTDIFLHFLLKKYGVDSSKVGILPVGQTQSLIAALQHGSVVAAISNQPMTEYLKVKNIAHVIIDASSPEVTKALYGGPFPWNVVLSRENFAEEHPEELTRFLAALHQASELLRTAPPERLASLLPSEAMHGDMKVETTALEAIRSSFAPTPIITETEYMRAVSQDAANTPDVRAAEHAGKLSPDKALRMDYARKIAGGG